MRAVIQRVLDASVAVDGEIIGKIKNGFLILLGVAQGDTKNHAELLAAKTAKLRVFCDEQDKMNLSIQDVGGSALVVSQFTLLADCRKGNRPSFTASAPPQEAKMLYEYYVEQLKVNEIAHVETGIFAADMKVSLVNDGPVTIIFDTEDWS